MKIILILIAAISSLGLIYIFLSLLSDMRIIDKAHNELDGLSAGGRLLGRSGVAHIETGKRRVAKVKRRSR